MKEAYVTYEVAKLLKEKRFDWECLARYDKSIFSNNISIFTEGNAIDWNTYYYSSDYKCSAPTQQMVCRWLREKHDIMIIPNRDKIVDVAPESFYDYWCLIRYNGNEYWVSSLDLPDGQHYIEYEDVVEAALEFTLKNFI